MNKIIEAPDVLMIDRGGFNYETLRQRWKSGRRRRQNS